MLSKILNTRLLVSLFLLFTHGSGSSVATAASSSPPTNFDQLSERGFDIYEKKHRSKAVSSQRAIRCVVRAFEENKDCARLIYGSLERNEKP